MHAHAEPQQQQQPPSGAAEGPCGGMNSHLSVAMESHVTLSMHSCSHSDKPATEREPQLGTSPAQQHGHALSSSAGSVVCPATKRVPARRPTSKVTPRQQSDFVSKQEYWGGASWSGELKPPSSCNGEATATAEDTTGQGGDKAVCTATLDYSLNYFRVVGATIRAHPVIVAVPLALCLVLAALGAYGIIEAASSHKDVQMAEARALGTQAGALFNNQFTLASAPTYSAANMIHQDPTLRLLKLIFPGMQANLRAAVPEVESMQVLPFGRFGYGYPAAAAPAGRPQPDLFLQDDTRAGMLHMVQASMSEAGQSVTPPRLVPASVTTVVARMPVIIPNVAANETWGLRSNVSCPGGPANINCTGATGCPMCYNATARSKFWGVVCAVVRIDKVAANVQYEAIISRGLTYRVTHTLVNGTVGVLTEAPGTPPAGPHCAHVAVYLALPGVDFYVCRAAGWQPPWLPPLMFLVVAISLTLSLTLFAAMYSHKRHLLLLNAMLPAKVVAKLKRGRQFMEKFPKPVTILFSDIVSWTTMASKMDPLEVVVLLNEVYTLFDQLVEKHNLYKVETIGDAFMCVGGCPIAEDPAQAALRVVRMAQDMVAATAHFQSRAGHRICIRVGVHSGPVVAAVIGTKMPRYCLWGDTVNTASRMESTSAPGCVHISNTTAELLRTTDEPDLCLLERAPIEVKGKGSMTTWWLAPAAVTDLGQGQGLAASGGSVCSTMTGCEDSALSCTAGGLSGSGDASLHTTTMMIGTAPLSRLATESRSGGAAGDRSGRPAARASGSYPRAPASPSGWQDHLQT